MIRASLTKQISIKERLKKSHSQLENDLLHQRKLIDRTGYKKENILCEGKIDNSSEQKEESKFEKSQRLNGSACLFRILGTSRKGFSWSIDFRNKKKLTKIKINIRKKLRIQMHNS